MWCAQPGCRIDKKRKAALSKGQTESLLSRAQAGSIEARNELLLENLGLIYSALNKTNTAGIDHAELFGELFLIAVDCVENYRSDCGASFPSYLAACLKFALPGILSDHLNNGILNARARQVLGKVRRIRARLAQKLGRDPLTGEVAAAAGVPYNVAMRYLGFTLPASLDKPIAGEDAEGSLIDTVPDPRGPREIELRELARALERALARLDDRSRSVVIDVVDEIPLGDIGRRLGLKSYQVITIRDRAYTRLRRMLAEAFPEVNKK